MESIKELRGLLQAEKVNPYGWSRPWGYKTFQRGPSIYITRLLLGTPITPNQVTIAGTLLGLLGCYFVLQFEWQLKLTGLTLLYMHILLDKVDGEIARYRKAFSLRGIYWDEVNHLIIPPIFWITLTFGISKITIYEFRDMFAIGICGALALIVNRIAHSLAPQIYAKKYLKHPGDFPLPQVVSAKNSAVKKYAFMAFLSRIVHQFQDFFIIIASTAAVLVFETLARPDAVFHPLLAYFLFGMSVLFILFAVENVMRKSLSIEGDIASIEKR